VTDGYGGTTAVPVTVPIAPQNTPPVAVAAKVSVTKPATGSVTGVVIANDADNDTLAYTAPSSIPKGTVSVNSSTGAFTYTPTAAARQRAAVAPPNSAAKTATFTVTVSDGHGGTATVPVRIKVK
jgi:VCBS repeat-containing protein